MSECLRRSTKLLCNVLENGTSAYATGTSLPAKSADSPASRKVRGRENDSTPVFEEFEAKQHQELRVGGRKRRSHFITVVTNADLSG